MIYWQWLTGDRKCHFISCLGNRFAYYDIHHELHDRKNFCHYLITSQNEHLFIANSALKNQNHQHQSIHYKMYVIVIES